MFHMNSNDLRRLIKDAAGLNASTVSLRQIAMQSGVNVSTLSRFCAGKQIKSNALDKLAQWARDQEQSK